MTENSKQSELQTVTKSSRGEAMGCPGVPLQHQGSEGADVQAPPTQDHRDRHVQVILNLLNYFTPMS